MIFTDFSILVPFVFSQIFQMTIMSKHRKIEFKLWLFNCKDFRQFCKFCWEKHVSTQRRVDDFREDKFFRVCILLPNSKRLKVHFIKIWIKKCKTMLKLVL